MPLPERLIHPVNVSRGTLQYPVPDELEGVTNGTLANIIRQLSSVSRHAEEMFGNLFGEAEVIAQRSSHLQARIDRLAVKVTQLDSTVEEVSLQDIHMKNVFRSSQTFDQQVVSRETMPKAMLEAYLACDKPPPLDNLNPYRDDGKDGLKFYTDPNYFFELWRQEMVKDTERMRHDKGRKGQSKHNNSHNQSQGGSEKLDRNNKKKVRNPSSTAEKQRQKAVNSGEYFPHNEYHPYGMEGKHEPPFNGIENGHGALPLYHPARPNSIELPEAPLPPPIASSYQGYNPSQEPIYTPRILRNETDKLGEPRTSRPLQFDPVNVKYSDGSQYAMDGYNMNPMTSYQTGFDSSHVASPSNTPTRRPNQPPPAPPPTHDSAGLGLRDHSFNSSLPPPPMHLGNDSSMLMMHAHNATGDLSRSNNEQEFLPPPPPVPKQESLPMEATNMANGATLAVKGVPSHFGAPSPPPPPPVTEELSNSIKTPSATGMAMNGPGSNGNAVVPPPPPPPPPGPVGKIIASNGLSRPDMKDKTSPVDGNTVDGLIKSPPKKAAPVQDGMRSDLLKAIRDGIALRRVERGDKDEDQRGGKEGGTADVASILARRVAVEMSDSEDGGAPSDSEYDSDEWGDESTA